MPDTLHVSFERLGSDLRALGLRQGDDVLVHSSLSRIGRVEGGAKTVVRAILAAVGPEGAALFPAHTGHREISPENPPVFDVRHSPATKVGAIPEAARQYPGAIRSLHPTHSTTAIGARAAWYTEAHERCATPCGIGSPHEKLSRTDGRRFILLLGCDHNSNTSMHMVEELADLPYHMLSGAGTARITDAGGVEHRLPARFHRYGIPRDFMRPDAEMTARGIQRIGRIGLAESRLVDAPAMRAFLLDLVAEDPSALLALEG